MQKCPLIKFMINSSMGSTTGLAPFEINCRYMPTMMREVTPSNKIPPGIRMFAQNTLKNMALAHKALIEAQVFQQHYADE